MASDVDICNIALSHLGSDAQVASIDPPDGSAEAGHCARFFPIVRSEMIEPYPWRFATTRAALATVANPSTVWQYAYALPSDMLRAWRVLRAGSVFVNDIFDLDNAGMLALPDERDCADFTIEGNVLLTHEPEAVLIYSRDVVDTALFSSSFRTGFGYLLAAYLAGPLIKGSEGARTGREFRKLAQDVVGGAAVNDANSGAEPANFIPDSIRARA